MPIAHYGRFRTRYYGKGDCHSQSRPRSRHKVTPKIPHLNRSNASPLGIETKDMLFQSFSWGRDMSPLSLFQALYNSISRKSLLFFRKMCLAGHFATWQQNLLAILQHPRSEFSASYTFFIHYIKYFADASFTHWFNTLQFFCLLKI